MEQVAAQRVGESRHLSTLMVSLAVNVVMILVELGLFLSLLYIEEYLLYLKLVYSRTRRFDSFDTLIDTYDSIKPNMAVKHDNI